MTELELSDEQWESLISFFQSNQTIVFLTGAGLSAESGISTFRGEDGLWSQYDPSEVATPGAFCRNTEKVRSFYRKRRREILQAQPSFSHRCLSRLEQTLPDVRVLTQNVDNLHEHSGQQSVIHLHGTIMQDQCVSCGREFDVPESLDRESCPECHGALRPAVVWFGESLDCSALRTAHQWINEATLLGVIGTSLEVAPVSGFPSEAHSAGARILEVNPEPVLQDMDIPVDFTFRGTSEQFFERWDLENRCF